MKTDQLFNLQGKVALVTGSTGGIGKTLAMGLAMNGVSVIINGRKKEKVESVCEEFSRLGLTVSGVAFDVTDSDGIRQAGNTILKNSGTPDIIVNNAGINIRHPLEAFPESDWDQVLNTNLKAVYLVTNAFIRPMLKRRSGKVINIGSLQSKLGRSTIAPYAASKGGLKMLTRSMATEWAGRNIQVNGIAPGYFKTKLTQPLYEDKEFDVWLKNRTPANRWGDPEELVGTMLFLASGASDYINGQLIFVDGGISASV